MKTERKKPERLPKNIDYSPIEKYIADNEPMSKARKRNLKGVFAIYVESDGLQAGLDCVKNCYRWRAEAQERNKEWEAKHQQRKEEKRKRAEELKQARLEALTRSEYIPAHLRPPKAACFICFKALRDPVSIKWGVGPDCIRQLAKQGCISTEVLQRRIADEAAERHNVNILKIQGKVWQPA
jgi:ribosomal protein S25